ncbi:MAG: EAL domain-containing protein [Thermodesulfovibrionales bacterium]
MTREFDPSYVKVVTDLLTKGCYSMAFQPIVDTGTGEAYGFEALLRGPKGTPLENPDKFFNRKDHETDTFLSHVDMACIWSAVRSGKILPSYAKIFINIHGNTVPQFFRQIGAFIEYLEELNIRPERIVIEISERRCHKNARTISRILKKLAGFGISLAIDDVSIDSPLLNHMMWLEPGYLKLDRSFCVSMENKMKKKDIVFKLSKMIGELDIRLVAKGIEKNMELSSVHELDIPLAQGFFIGRPLPAEDWSNKLRGSNYQMVPVLQDKKHMLRH